MQGYPATSASTSPASQHLTSPVETAPFNTFDSTQGLSSEMFNFNSQQLYNDSGPSQQWPFQGTTEASSSTAGTSTGVRFGPMSPLMSYSIPATGNGTDSSTHFDLGGLPFSGMDFLQGFTPAMTPNIDSGADNFWNSYGGGAGAFKFGPELPFNLSDNLGDDNR
jgi:hypothetical protein